MIHFDLLVLSLPVIFMLHDFEEIILFRKWLNDNGSSVSARFPRLNAILSRANKISTPAFTIAVAEEFLLLSFISFSAVYYGYYYLWFAAFMAFFLHIFIHIGQCIVFWRYTPGVVTSLLLLPICIYMLNYVLQYTSYSTLEILALSACGLVIMIGNLLLIHYLTGKLKI